MTANRIVHTLSTNITAITSDEPIVEVFCGSCNLCCQLLSPHLTPDEISLGKYPISLIKSQNPEEGPIVVMFKSPTGGCSMFVDNKCSIYDNRPLACRQFDCRKGHHSKTNHIAHEKFGINL